MISDWNVWLKHSFACGLIVGTIILNVSTGSTISSCRYILWSFFIINILIFIFLVILGKGPQWGSGTSPWYLLMLVIVYYATGNCEYYWGRGKISHWWSWALSHKSKKRETCSRKTSQGLDFQSTTIGWLWRLVDSTWNCEYSCKSSCCKGNDVSFRSNSWEWVPWWCKPEWHASELL